MMKKLKKLMLPHASLIVEIIASSCCSPKSAISTSFDVIPYSSEIAKVITMFVRNTNPILKKDVVNHAIITIDNR